LNLKVEQLFALNGRLFGPGDRLDVLNEATAQELLKEELVSKIEATEGEGIT
jgi:hypothetical protein